VKQNAGNASIQLKDLATSQDFVLTSYTNLIGGETSTDVTLLQSVLEQVVQKAELLGIGEMTLGELDAVLIKVQSESAEGVVVEVDFVKDIDMISVLGRYADGSDFLGTQAFITPIEFVLTGNDKFVDLMAGVSGVYRGTDASETADLSKAEDIGAGYSIYTGLGNDIIIGTQYADLIDLSAGEKDIDGGNGDDVLDITSILGDGHTLTVSFDESIMTYTVSDTTEVLDADGNGTGQYSDAIMFTVTRQDNGSWRVESTDWGKENFRYLGDATLKNVESIRVFHAWDQGTPQYKTLDLTLWDLSTLDSGTDTGTDMGTKLITSSDYVYGDQVQIASFLGLEGLEGVRFTELSSSDNIVLIGYSYLVDLGIARLSLETFEQGSDEPIGIDLDKDGVVSTIEVPDPMSVEANYLVKSLQITSTDNSLISTITSFYASDDYDYLGTITVSESLQSPDLQSSEVVLSPSVNAINIEDEAYAYGDAAELAKFFGLENSSGMKYIETELADGSIQIEYSYLFPLGSASIEIQQLSQEPAGIDLNDNGIPGEEAITASEYYVKTSIMKDGSGDVTGSLIGYYSVGDNVSGSPDFLGAIETNNAGSITYNTDWSIVPIDLVGTASDDSLNG